MTENMRKISLKAGLIISVVTLLVIGVCGCMFEKDKKRYPLFKESCEAYLEEKYGEDFIFAEAYDDFQPEKSSAKWFFRSAALSVNEGSDDKILVRVWFENDKVNYRDNYLAFYFGEQRLRIMNEIAREVYGECRVKSPVVKGHVLPENFNKNTSLSEYLGSDGSNLKCEIFLAPGYDDSDREEKLRALYEKFHEKNVICCANVFYTTDEAVYDNFEDPSLRATKGWHSYHGQIWLHGNVNNYEKEARWI